MNEVNYGDELSWTKLNWTIFREGKYVMCTYNQRKGGSEIEKMIASCIPKPFNLNAHETMKFIPNY